MTCWFVSCSLLLTFFWLLNKGQRTQPATQPDRKHSLHAWAASKRTSSGSITTAFALICFLVGKVSLGCTSAPAVTMTRFQDSVPSRDHAWPFENFAAAATATACHTRVNSDGHDRDR
jgi:hypothetical protein